LKFTFRADCFDVTNKVTFSLAQTQAVDAAVELPNPNKLTTISALEAPGTAIKPTDSPAFGHLSSYSGNRKFQFSGRIVF